MKRHPRAVTRLSEYSGVFHTLSIQMTDSEWNEVQEFIVDRFKARKIQDILPFHTPDEREFILTGITAEEWRELVGE